jgi:hypothetical protein
MDRWDKYTIEHMVGDLFFVPIAFKLFKSQYSV